MSAYSPGFPRITDNLPLDLRKVERDCSARIIRDGIVVFEGKLASLKRLKDDVKEVKAGYECGFVFEKYNDIKEGDQVEAFKMVEKPR